MLFVLLNAFITIIVVAAGWEVIKTKVAQYMAAFLIMSGLMNGIFTALDGILFYVFFEASLIPLYLIIGVWGGPNRVYAAIKFPPLHPAGLVAVPGCADVPVLQGRVAKLLHSRSAPAAAGFDPADLGIPRFYGRLLCGESADVAGVIPGCPYVEAPTGGSIVLAAIAPARRIRFPALLPADCSGCVMSLPAC